MLYDYHHNFKPVFYLAAGPMGVGAFMLFLVPYFKPDSLNSYVARRQEMTQLAKSSELSTTNTTQVTQLPSTTNIIVTSSCNDCRQKEKGKELQVVDRLTSL